MFYDEFIRNMIFHICFSMKKYQMGFVVHKMLYCAIYIAYHILSWPTFIIVQYVSNIKMVKVGKLLKYGYCFRKKLN